MSVRWALGEKAWSGNVRFSGGARMGVDRGLTLVLCFVASLRLKLNWCSMCSLADPASCVISKWNSGGLMGQWC